MWHWSEHNTFFCPFYGQFSGRLSQPAAPGPKGMVHTLGGGLGSVSQVRDARSGSPDFQVKPKI